MDDDYDEENSRTCKWIIFFLSAILFLVSCPLSLGLILYGNSLDNCPYRIDIVFALTGSTQLTSLLLIVLYLNTETWDNYMAWLLEKNLQLGLMLPLTFTITWWVFLGFLNECSEETTSATITLYWSVMIVGSYFALVVLMFGISGGIELLQHRLIKNRFWKRAATLLLEIVKVGHSKKTSNDSGLKNTQKGFLKEWIQEFTKLYSVLKTPREEPLDPIQRVILYNVICQEQVSFTKKSNFLCSNCLVEFRTGEEVVSCDFYGALPHAFHKECFKKMLMASASCQTCSISWRFVLTHQVSIAKDRLNDSQYPDHD